MYKCWNAKKEKQDSQAQKSIEEQDKEIYAHFKDTLKRRFRNKETMKTVLSIVIILSTIAFSVVTLYILWWLAKKPGEYTAAFITAIGGLLGTLLALPMVMAKYLFNKDEDELIKDQLTDIRKTAVERAKKGEAKEDKDKINIQLG